MCARTEGGGGGKRRGRGSARRSLCVTSASFPPRSSARGSVCGVRELPAEKLAAARDAELRGPPVRVVALSLRLGANQQLEWGHQPPTQLLSPRASERRAPSVTVIFSNPLARVPAEQRAESSPPR